MTPQTVYLIWWISIALLLVVTVVVGLLLSFVLGAARDIYTDVGKIWTAGKLVANNTIHVPMLNETNGLVKEILGTTGKIAAGANSIEQHAEGCPGCPACVLER